MMKYTVLGILCAAHQTFSVRYDFNLQPMCGPMRSCRRDPDLEARLLILDVPLVLEHVQEAGEQRQVHGQEE